MFFIFLVFILFLCFAFSVPIFCFVICSLFCFLLLVAPLLDRICGSLHSLVVTSFYVSVKYLREVTPFIRKATILSDIGWESQKPFLASTAGVAQASEQLPSNKPNDTISIPLLLCHLAKQLKMTDGNTMEIHSPDGQHCCILRASDSAQKSQW